MQKRENDQEVKSKLPAPFSILPSLEPRSPILQPVSLGKEKGIV